MGKLGLIDVNHHLNGVTLFLCYTPNLFFLSGQYASTISLTVNDKNQVMLMGTSKDLGVCRSRTKAGNPCTNIINKLVKKYTHPQKYSIFSLLISLKFDQILLLVSIFYTFLARLSFKKPRYLAPATNML